MMGGGQGGRSHAPQRLLRSRHLITCVWAYQACAEPGDKLLGPHSWEGALGRADVESIKLLSTPQSTNFCRLQQKGGSNKVRVGAHLLRKTHRRNGHRLAIALARAVARAIYSRVVVQCAQLVER